MTLLPPGGGSQNNYVAVAAPAVTDDSGAGYAIGSQWLDTSVAPDKMYVCTDATVGAAVWAEDTGGKNNFIVASFYGTRIHAPDQRFCLMINSSGFNYFHEYETGINHELQTPAPKHGGTFQTPLFAFAQEVGSTYYIFLIYRELNVSVWEHYIVRYEIGASSPLAPSDTTGVALGNAIADTLVYFNSLQNKLVIANSSFNSTTTGIFDIYDLDAAANTLSLDTSHIVTGTASATSNLVLSEDASSLYFSTSTTTKLARKWDISSNTEDLTSPRLTSYDRANLSIAINGVPYIGSFASNSTTAAFIRFNEY